MSKLLLSFVLIFQLVAMTLPQSEYTSSFNAEAAGENCNKIKDDKSRQDCIVKERTIVHQGYSAGDFGADFLTIIALTLSAYGSVSLPLKLQCDKTTKTGPTYFACNINRMLVAAGAIAYFGLEIKNMKNMKKDCTDLLTKSGAELSDLLGAELVSPKKLLGGNFKDKAGETVVNATIDGQNRSIKAKELSALVNEKCTGISTVDTSNGNGSGVASKESQALGYCRAKACSASKHKTAVEKVNNLKLVEYAYYGAVLIELTNVLVNVIQGNAYSDGPQAVATGTMASNCYQYCITEDTSVREGGITKNSFPNFLPENLKYVRMENELDQTFNHLDRFDNLSSYVTTSIDHERLLDGAKHSTSYKEYEKNKVFELPSVNSIFKNIQMAIKQLKTNLDPLPEAHAGSANAEILTKLGITAAISAVLLIAIKKTQDTLASKALTRPCGRMAYWGALGALVSVNKTIYRTRIVNKLAEQYYSFDTAINGLVVDVTPTATPTPVGTPTPPPVPTSPNVKPPQVASGGECIDENMQVDENCTCKNNNKCQNIDIPEVKLPNSNMKIPTVITELTRNMSAGSSAIANGDFNKGNLYGDKLGAMSGALGDLQRQLKRKYEDSLKGRKHTPHDFDGEAQKMQNEILAAYAKDLGQAAPSSTTGGDGIADVGGKGSAEPAEGTTPMESKAFGAAGSAKPSVPVDPSLGLEEMALTEEIPLDQEGAQAFNQYEMNNQDIQKSDSDLFKTISSRYMQSGYSKLLKEEKKSIKTETK